MNVGIIYPPDLRTRSRENMITYRFYPDPPTQHPGRLHHQPPSTSMYYRVLALVDHTCTLHIANFLLSIPRHTDHILQIPTKFLIPCVSRILGSNSISCNTQVSIDNLTKLENFFTLDPLGHLTVPLRMHWPRKSRSQAL